MNIDTVTVVYRDELELLKKQAEKFNYHMRFPNLQNVYVILNDDELQIKDVDVNWWGWFREHARVIHRNEFGYYPPPNIKGWYTQQVCKILGTVNAESEWCLIYDAKTLPNQPYESKLIFDGERGRFADWSANISPHWHSGLEFLKNKYDIKDFKWISPAGVPFLAHVPTMRAMVYEEPDFVEWFHTYCDFPNKFNSETRGITEFLCYSAYVSSIPGLFEKLYTGEQVIEVANLADWEVDNFDKWMANVKRVNPFTVSIHPRAYKLLSEQQQREWDEYIN